MRIAGLMIFGFLAAAQPASAAKYPDTQIGDWSLTGEGKVCTAGKSVGGTTIVLVSADGDNDGGIALTTGSSTGGDGDPVDLEFRIGGRREIVPAQVMTDPKGYWIPYGMSTDMTRLPDDAKLQVRDHGKLILDAPLGPIGKVVAMLRACDAQLDRAESV